MAHFICYPLREIGSFQNISLTTNLFEYRPCRRSHSKSGGSFRTFTLQTIDSLQRNGKRRTAETYESALKSFQKFLLYYLPKRKNRGDIPLSAITSELMEAFETWHKSQNNSLNTISFYLRILRAVYNRAVREGLITDRKPFRNVYTGVARTQKRALPVSVISKIRTLSLPSNSSLDHARNMFLLSFYLRGMSTIDMAFLRKTDLQNGVIKYHRRKTGQLISISWTEEMQEILGKYPARNGKLLFPIISEENTDLIRAYRNASYNLNYNLKRIAKLIGEEKSFTMYAARHSWASIAREMGVATSIISQALGHESETTTRIYLKEISSNKIDEANSLVIAQV